MKQKKFITCDGNQAAAHISYMFSEVAAIYPITPSSTMAEYVDEWAAQGRKNLFGETVLVQEMQSEAGAAGAVHGSLQAGALTTTYTASQGLLLMIPNMYKIAGELLPGVFHVSARTLASHSLCIFGDHQDVMSTRQTGFAMLAEGSVQEVMDLAGVAHLSAISARVPFVNFFDGFRTSHEIQKIERLDNEDLAPLLDREALEEFRARALRPDKPVMRGMAENPDTFFPHREICNKYYDAVPDIVNGYMQKISAITGRTYAPFCYYGDPDAERIIIAMGSVTECAREVVDHLMAQGEKVGLISVHLYRPFSIKYLQAVMPRSVQRIAVLDRTKEPGAQGEPLYMDVVEAFANNDMPCNPIIVGGRYGLGSRDTTPAQLLAVYDNLKMRRPKNHFTIGIVDDVTFTSLPQEDEIAMGGANMFQAKFYGLGADGTVGANKNSVKIIGETTDKYCQAYFSYDSKKSGGFTCSHLRFGDEPIRSTYLVTTPNFVACHVQAYLRMYDVTRGLQDGGTFLLNTIWEGYELEKNLPNYIKRYFAEHNITVYYINATRIAQEIGLGNRTNTILQSAFFRITNVIPVDKAVDEMKHFIVKSYGKKGEDVVNKNYAAVDRGAEYKQLYVNPSWAALQPDGQTQFAGESKFIADVVRPINAQNGDLLPVSAFKDSVDGTWMPGTAAYEKRGVSAFVPTWIGENCIECNRCSYVCPHACIRPFVLDENEVKAVENRPHFVTREMKAPASMKGMHFRIQVDILDCLGCGNCVDVCPGNPKTGKALKMMPLEEKMHQADNWKYCVTNIKSKQRLVDIEQSVKNSQFATPLFEFSGACSGCGETPYLKLISQLFGDREMVSNATGCSSIYSGSIPSTPYTKDADGRGPAWANSLFEDFCEFGLGMQLANKRMRIRLTHIMEEAIANDTTCPDALKAMFREWIDGQNEVEVTRHLYQPIIRGCEACASDYCRQVLELKSFIVKRAHWIVGGDGASYDIGYGGLDHVIASGEDVNILVLDTEVYSNTGGQASKATPLGAIAKFAASGKRVRKKDLGMIATTYGYVYVAQVAMGADQAQTLKAIREAVAYHGPSIVIAYAPCINHGLKSGMGKSQEEERRAVECGYWHLWRYNPDLEKEGKNPFQLDSKEPDWDKFQEFLKGEVRYASVMKQFPEEAEQLFEAAKENAQWRYRSYQRMLNTNW
ncbi:MAG: pyruvate:ferredoxin (flavodoxin) oxidoreductase [Paludibacteraceae bacterium]|nr:pyruvate:ferredoxin (flavodoxin) oxidoreductase [Paludibacteraceae bacterium]